MPITINGTTDSRIGVVSATISEFSTDWDGTHVAPGNNAGSFNFSIASFTVDFDGQFAGSASFDGDVAVTLGSFSANLIGNQIQNIDGFTAATINSFSAAFFESPVPILLDGQETPEQIALYVDATSYTQAATATCEYKKTADVTWIEGHPLYRVQPSLATNPTKADDVFAWTILGLDSGTSYDVRVTVTDSPSQFTGILTTTTKSLPATAGAANKSFNAGALTQGDINLFAPGDVVRLNDGTHDLNGLTFGVTGTPSQPIYIRGQSRDGTIVQSSINNVIFELQNCSNVIFENLTIQGSGVHGGTGAASRAFRQQSVYSSTNVTVRNITCTGVDRFWDTYDCTGVLIYDNTVTGNNAWTDTYNESQLGWSHYGVIFPGNGNCAFQNTMTGFGDTFSCGRSGDIYNGTNIHFYRNKIRNSVDDLLEADGGNRNITFYDNHATNSANLDSVDGFNGGPLIVARNIVINPYRPKPHKWNSEPAGSFLYNNTLVSTITQSGPNSASEDVAAWYQPTSFFDHIGVRNNVHVYGGNGDTIWMDSVTGFNTVDWSNNAWYPDRTWQIAGLLTGSPSTLAAAKLAANPITPIFSGKQALVDDVIVSANPFDVTVSLGVDSAVEITAFYTPRIASGQAAKNAGQAIPNITDGFTGAAPDMGALPDGLSIPSYGDRSSIPAYLQNAAAFEVIALTGANSPGSNETIEDMISAEWVTYEGTSARNIVNAWSGGVGTSDGRLFIHGGGHDDSANNGIYVYDFMGETPGGFSLVPNSRSAVADVPTNTGINHQTFDDNYPSAIHSYNGLSYDETNGDFYRWMGSICFQGGASSNGFRHDGSSWTLENVLQDIPETSGIVTATVLNQQARKILAARSSRLFLNFYDIASNTWDNRTAISTQVNGNNPYHVFVEDTDQNWVFHLGGNVNRYYDVNWTAETLTDNGFTPQGSAGALGEDALGAVYDPIGKKIWIYGGKASSAYDTVTEMDPVSFNCVEHTLTGVTPSFSGVDYQGFFNRLVWIAEYNAIGFVTAYDQPAYIFKVS